jgi:release factor glutamine methyltransferase
MQAELESLADRLRAIGCVFAEDEARLLAGAASDSAHLDAMVEQRASGQPLETVIGSVRFCGIDVTLRPGVFVPRPRTRFLAERAVSACREWESARGQSPVVVDVCTGSGALAAVVASEVVGSTVCASDLDPVAVACASVNGARFGFSVGLGDLMDGVPTLLHGHVSVIVANVPYVPTDQLQYLPRDVLEHEPVRALDGGPTGLDVFGRLCRAAPAWLAEGGVVMSEVSPAQVREALALLEGAGLVAEVTEHPSWRTAVVQGGRSGALGPG